MACDQGLHSLLTGISLENKVKKNTVKILNIGTYMSEQTVYILIRLLRIYTFCHSVYIFWRHYCIVKSNCFVLRTTTVVSLGVPIFRVFTVFSPETPKTTNRLFQMIRMNKNPM